MVLSEEQKKLNKKISDKKYREKNKEKLNKQRMETYYKNHEKEKEYRRQYAKKICSEKNEVYKKKVIGIKKYIKTDNGYKNMMKAKWKSRGVNLDNFENMWKEYLTQTHCEVCGIEFKNKSDKCLDHDHETGYFRFISCKNCNWHDLKKF